MPYLQGRLFIHACSLMMLMFMIICIQVQTKDHKLPIFTYIQHLGWLENITMSVIGQMTC